MIGQVILVMMRMHVHYALHLGLCLEPHALEMAGTARAQVVLSHPTSWPSVNMSSHDPMIDLDA